MKIYPKLPQHQNLQAVFFKIGEQESSILHKESSIFLSKITNNSDELNNSRNNINLVGHIEHEYFLSEETTNFIEKLLSPAVEEYTRVYMPYTFISLDNLVINTKDSSTNPCWINFQKKTEYNPLHMHNGLLSFVIWIRVPYTIENENQWANASKMNNINKCCNGNFCFYQPSATGIEEFPLKVDETWENRGVLFSSKLYHTVYPFYTSDEYRISISGNFRIK